MKKIFTYIYLFMLFFLITSEIVAQTTELQIERMENLLGLIGKYKSSHSFNGMGNNWTGSIKRTFSFDGKTRPTEFIRQQWNIDNWTDEIKYVYSYYPNDSLSIIQQMEEQLGQWYNSQRDTLTYNQNQLLTERLKQLALGNDWLNSQKTTYSYNDSNRMTESIIQSWKNNDWVNLSRNVFEYENMTNLKSFTTQTWDSSEWRNQIRNLSSYDSSSRTSENLSQRWNDSLSLWEDTRKDIRKFDEEGKLIENSNEQERDGIMSPQRKSEFLYNVNGKLERTNNYRWEDSIWSLNSRITYTINANGKAIEYLNEEWNDSTNTWSNRSKAFYEYDENGYLTDFKRFNWSNGNWSNNQWLSYNYNLLPVKEENMLSISKSYPNPFRDITVISYELNNPGDVNIIITDLQGNEIVNFTEKKDKGSYEFEFDGSLLPQGFYISTIWSGRDFITNKLILNR